MKRSLSLVYSGCFWVLYLIEPAGLHRVALDD